MKRYGALLVWIFKLSMPATLLILVAVTVFGSFMPWKPADSLLRSYGSQTPVTVGFSYNYQMTADVKKTVASRSYILIPSVFTDPKIITVEQVNEGELTSVEAKSEFLFLLVWIAISITGTWFFWFRKRGASAI